METRIHPATLIAAAAVLRTDLPEFGDPKRLLAALQMATQTKERPETGAGAGPRLLTLRQAGEWLGVCRRTVGHWVAEGRLPARKTGRKFVRVLENDLRAFMGNLPLRPVSATDAGNDSTNCPPKPIKKSPDLASYQPHGNPSASSSLPVPQSSTVPRTTMTRGRGPTPARTIHATPA
jgi:excisionase family DNA binding protein